MIERLELINSLMKCPNIYKNLNELNARNIFTGISEVSCEANEMLIDIIIDFIQSTRCFDEHDEPVFLMN